MNKKNNAGNTVNEDYSQNGSATELACKLIVQILEKPQNTRIITTLISDILDQWSDNGPLKKTVARAAKKIISGITSPKPQSEGKKSKAEIFLTTGMLITILAKEKNNCTEENRELAEEEFRKNITTLVQSTDFGEIKEAFDKAAANAPDLIKILNEVMWENPGKLVSFFAMVPEFLNIIIKSLHHTVSPLSNVMPELLSDIIISIIQNIRFDEIGDLINQLSEAMRSFHTGSALLGGTGSSRLEKEITQKLNDTASALDPELFFKAKKALAETARIIKDAETEMLANHEEIMKKSVESAYFRKNSKINAFSNRISVFENLTDEVLSNEIYNALIDLDMQETGEIVNISLRILNRIHEIRPEIGTVFFSGLSNTIDPYVLQETAEWLIKDAFETIKPLSSALMPSVLRGISDLLTPSPGEESAELNDAIASIRNVLLCEEPAI